MIALGCTVRDIFINTDGRRGDRDRALSPKSVFVDKVSSHRHSRLSAARSRCYKVAPIEAAARNSHRHSSQVAATFRYNSPYLRLGCRGATYVRTTHHHHSRGERKARSRKKQGGRIK